MNEISDFVYSGMFMCFRREIEFRIFSGETSFLNQKVFAEKARTEKMCARTLTII